MENINFNNLDVFIERNLSRNSVSVWVTEINPDKNYNISINDGMLLRTEVNPSECLSDDVKPFLKLPRYFFDVLVKSLIGSDTNIATENENLIKGKLLATEEHLKDMREFSKKLLDFTIQ